MPGIKKEKVQLILWQTQKIDRVEYVCKNLDEAFNYDVEKIYYLYTEKDAPEHDSTLPIERVHVPIKNPADHKEVYEKLKSILESKIDCGEFSNLRICATGGTAAMHAVWIVLFAGGFFPDGTILLNAENVQGAGNEINLKELHFEVNTYLSEIRKAERENGSGQFFEENPKSARMKSAREEIQKYARVSNIPLLIFGERGIGKTTAAKNWIRAIKTVKEGSENAIRGERSCADKLLEAIRGVRKKEQGKSTINLIYDLEKAMKLERSHDCSDSFVHIACGSLNKNLADPQIFGYVSGAYSGAKEGGEIGLIEKARNGILFLDEIQDLEQPVQRKLVKLLENHVYTMYGDASATEVPIRFSLVCATNISEQDLKKKLDLDFYDRISMYKVTLPPLRERKEDLQVLWKMTWKNACNETGNGNLANEPFMDESLKRYLETSDLAGNFRSLRRIALLKIALGNSRSTEEILKMVDADDRIDNLPAEALNEGLYAQFEKMPWKKAEMLFKKELVHFLEKKYGSLAEVAKKMDCTLKTLQNVKKNAEKNGL